MTSRTIRIISNINHNGKSEGQSSSEPFWQSSLPSHFLSFAIHSGGLCFPVLVHLKLSCEHLQFFSSGATKSGQRLLSAHVTLVEPIPYHVVQQSFFPSHHFDLSIHDSSHSQKKSSFPSHIFQNCHCTFDFTILKPDLVPALTCGRLHSHQVFLKHYLKLTLKSNSTI